VLAEALPLFCIAFHANVAAWFGSPIAVVFFRVSVFFWLGFFDPLNLSVVSIDLSFLRGLGLRAAAEYGSDMSSLLPEPPDMADIAESLREGFRYVEGSDPKLGSEDPLAARSAVGDAADRDVNDALRPTTATLDRFRGGTGGR
jgi:hypothetical protein